MRYVLNAKKKTMGVIKEANDLYDDKQYDEAFPLLEILANGGYAPAQNKLGVCYAKGRGVLQDYAAPKPSNGTIWCLMILKSI